MGFISTIKSVLGLDRSDREEAGDPDVTVEREPDAGSERAVKESDARDSAEGSRGEAVEGSGEARDVEGGGEESGEESESGAEPEGDSVENVKGIGPAYADRLESVGVRTVDELAASDPEEVAAETDISENRIETWIERAKTRL